MLFLGGNADVSGFWRGLSADGGPVGNGNMGRLEICAIIEEC